MIKLNKKKERKVRNRERGDEMKKNHGTLFWGALLIAILAVISLCVYLATRQSRAKQTARLVLERKAAIRVILEEGAWKVDYLVIKAGCSAFDWIDLEGM